MTNTCFTLKKPEWTKQQTIDQLLKKAKFKEPVTEETYRHIKLVRYQV